MPGNQPSPWLTPHKPSRNITAVAVTFRVGLSVFLPEDRHRDARTLQLARQGRPVRPDPPPLALRDPGATKKLALQSLVGDVVRQRPCQPGRCRPFQIILDRRARHAQTSPDLARACVAIVACSIPASPASPISSSTIDGPGVPQLMNRGEQTLRAVTGSGGRLHFGMVAGIKSECLRVQIGPAAQEPTAGDEAGPI